MHTFDTSNFATEENGSKMFFAVYLVRFKRYIVVPKNWIHDLSFEKHVNYSINRNQKYHVFYTASADAFINGVPNGNFAPDFNGEIGVDCHICKLAKFFGNYMVFCAK